MKREKEKTCLSPKPAAYGLKLKATRGFTLIELMVSIAIFVIITAVIVISQNRFGGSIMVTNLAYDVALSVRQAQVYGMSVKQSPVACTAGAVTSKFQCSYGVHFGPSDHYILFADLNGTGYDTSNDNGTNCTGPECLDVYQITKGNYISDFCIDNSCKSNSGINHLDIVFHRPNPEPALNGQNSGVASITVTSPQGISKTVLISSAAGEISVR